MQYSASLIIFLFALMFYNGSSRLFKVKYKNLLNKDWISDSCKISTKVECAYLCLRMKGCDGFGFYKKLFNDINCIILSRLDGCFRCNVVDGIVIYEIDKWNLESGIYSGKKNNFSTVNKLSDAGNKINNIGNTFFNNDEDKIKTVSDTDSVKDNTDNVKDDSVKDATDLVNSANSDTDEIVDNSEDTADEVIEEADDAINDAEETKEIVDDFTDDGEDTAESVVDSASNSSDSANDSASKAASDASDSASDASDSASDSANEVFKAANDIGFSSFKNTFGKRDCSPVIVSCEDTKVLIGIQSKSKRLINSLNINSICKETNFHRIKNKFSRKVVKGEWIICPKNQIISELFLCLREEENDTKIQSGKITCSSFEENFYLDKENITKNQFTSDAYIVSCSDNSVLVGLMVNDNDDTLNFSLKCSTYHKKYLN